jgi:hypothetical protein
VGFTGCTSLKGKCHRSIKSGEFRVRDLKLFKLSCASLLDYSAYFKKHFVFDLNKKHKSQKGHLTPSKPFPIRERHI